jgi:hypothetical protein
VCVSVRGNIRADGQIWGARPTVPPSESCCPRAQFWDRQTREDQGNHIAERSFPLGSLADNVYLHYHADGVWKIQVGYMLREKFAVREGPTYPTLVDTLRAAVQGV